MSDYDGDIVANSDNPVFIRARYKDEVNSLPITYEKKTVAKKIIEEKNLYKADLNSFNTTIGQVTNYSTSFYDLLCKYEGKSDEYSIKCYNEILERLKLTRMEQGNAIDAAKGIRVDPYPSIWTRRQKTTSEDTELIKARKDFLNDVCADRKPYFFKYRYPASNRDYEEYLTVKEACCYSKFNKHISEIIEVDDSQLTEEELEFKKQYYEFAPLINYQGPMNKVCNYLEKKLQLIKTLKKKKTPEYVIALMQSENKIIEQSDLDKIKEMYDSYVCKKRELKLQQVYAIKNISQKISIEDDHIINIEQYAKKLRQEAEEYFRKNCENGQKVYEKIADVVVEYCYIEHSSKSKAFAWNVFGKYIVENIKTNTLKHTNKTTIPCLDKDGDIEYLYKKFKEVEIDIEEQEEVVVE